MTLRNIFRNLIFSILRKYPPAEKMVRTILGHTHSICLDYPVNPVPRYGYGKPPHPGLHALVSSQNNNFSSLTESFSGFSTFLKQIKHSSAENPIEPYWNNTWFYPFDAVSLYCMLALRKPKLFVEIGSGFSTMFARRAINDLRLDTKIFSIDPQPRAGINRICDKITRTPFEDCGFDPYQLGGNDILFIDSSHRALPNSDVTMLFLETIPKLKQGVILHIHDIFIPHDYPPEFSERYYSEQYLLSSVLLSNPDYFKILLANAYITSEPLFCELLSELRRECGLGNCETTGSSFWLEKN